jgi:hypothetical protein
MTLHRYQFTTALAAYALTGVLVAASPATAQTSAHDTTRLAFSSPVMIPNVTLPAGEYVFTIADKSSARSVVQVWNADRTTLMTQALVVPARRSDNTGQLAVTFSDTPQGIAPALRGWFVTGQSIGHEFVYPKDQASVIAKMGETLVLSSDHDLMDGSTMDGAALYRIDHTGRQRAYKDPDTWDAAPVMTRLVHVAPLVVVPVTPTQIINTIDAIVADALTTGQPLSPDSLRRVDELIDRLRVAISMTSSQ